MDAIGSQAGRRCRPRSRPGGPDRLFVALGRAPRLPAVLRNVLGGAVAMGVTYGIGSLIGASGI